MNTERLHAIALVLDDEIKKSDIVNRVEQIRVSLQNIINQPQLPAHQQKLGDSLKVVCESLDKAPSNNFTPTWRQILKELGGDLLLGNLLKERIQNIFERNQITNALALQEIQEIQKNLVAFSQAIGKIVSGFSQLGIGSEKLEPGECEIAILVPRIAVEDSIIKFGAELEELSFLLNVFSEVATGKREQAKLKSISSTDYMVYLDACLLVGGLVTFVVLPILSAYKKLLEIRKLHGGLSEQGVPKKSMEGIEQHANKIMEDSIEKITIDVMKTYYKGRDPDRKNELENAVRISLRKIANRIDKGYSIDVRVEPPKKLKEAKESAGDKDAEEIITFIQQSSQAMQYLKLQGQPLLHLSEKPEEKETERVIKVKKQKSRRIDTNKE